MMFTSYTPIYDTDFSVKDEYSNEDWNQVKGIHEDKSNGFINTLILVLKNFRKYELEQKRLENKKIEIENKPEESDESVFSYLIPKQDTTPFITKFDIDVPIIDIKNETNDNGWKVVNKHKIKSVNIDKKKLDAKVKKSQMCNSVKDGIISKCPHGKSCRFAHTLEELTPVMCQHAKLCKFVQFTGGCYCNIGDKICFYQHVDEKIEDYLIRVGLKKRGPVTEDEMQDAFDEFLKPVIEVEKKPVYVKNKNKIKNTQKSPIKIISNKDTKFISKNLEKLKIEKRNEINIKIRDIKFSIKRSLDTVNRFREMREMTEFYKKQILKLEDYIKNKETEIKILEKKFKDVDSMKIEDKSKVENIKIESEHKIVEKVLEKKEVTVYLYNPNKVINVVDKVQIEELSNLEDGWIDVKPKKINSKLICDSRASRNNAFDILKNSEKINSTRIKTKMCFKGKNCKHKGCTFAHNEKELKISNCVFGKNCKFVEKKSGILINVCKTQMCKHKHEEETMTEFYLRLRS